MSRRFLLGPRLLLAVPPCRELPAAAYICLTSPFLMRPCGEGAGERHRGRRAVKRSVAGGVNKRGRGGWAGGHEAVGGRERSFNQDNGPYGRCLHFVVRSCTTWVRMLCERATPTSR